MIWPLAPAVCEGALARVSGLERDQNPYDVSNAEDRYDAWVWGWLYANRLLELNFEHLEAGGWEDEAA